MWQLLMMILIMGLQMCPTQMIKIGISHNYNATTTSTPSTLATTTTEGSTSISDLSTSPNPPTEMASTPSQTFPPRRQQRATSTTSTTTTTPAPPPPLPNAETQTIANATVTPSSSSLTPIGGNSRNHYYCTCDLRAGVCDLNCCCDRDCSTKLLVVFNCLDLAEPPELQTRLEDFQYTHGLPTCQLHDGWLCVFRSNTKPIKLEPISSDFDTLKYRKWPDLLEAYDANMDTNMATSLAHYKLGQPLQLWHSETKQASVFNLPTNYGSSHCHLKQAIRHLQSTESNCLMNDQSQLQENLGLVLNLSTNHQLLGKPRDIDETETQGLTIQICQLWQGKLLCFDQANETQLLDVTIDKIELEFLHNYTNILGAKLILSEAAAPRDIESDELWLHYKVTFRSVNESAGSKPVSGPLGYLTGSPVLVSQLLPRNDSSNDVPQILSYFQSNDINRDYHWLPLFHRQLGACQRSLHENQALRFGINLAQQCQLNQLDAPQLQENANHTQYCETLQAEIWHKLLPHNCSSLEKVQQIFISQLGRPQVDKWLPLRLDYGKDLHNLPPVQGSYNAAQQSLSCRNMFLSVRYEFHVAQLTLLDGRAPHQQVLQHARLVLGQRHDLEFDGSEQQIELPLAVSVMFYKVRDKTINGAEQHFLYKYYLSISILCLLMVK